MKKLVNESNFSRFIDNSDLDKEIATLATKTELKFSSFNSSF